MQGIFINIEFVPTSKKHMEMVNEEKECRKCYGLLFDLDIIMVELIIVEQNEINSKLRNAIEYEEEY